MADKPPANLEALQAHLRQVTEDPDTRLDQRLLETFQAQLTETNLEPLVPSLYPQLLELLPVLREDPEPVVNVIIRVAAPLSFTSALSYVDGSNSLVEALRSTNTSINILALEILHKAASGASDAAILAGMKDVVHELVTVFLTHETAAAVAAQRSLESLLLVDIHDAAMDATTSSFGGMTLEYQMHRRGQGLMWRRLFEDRDIYRLFYSLTSVGVGSPPNARDERKQRTIAQTRLMGLLPYIARLDFRAISQSHCAEVEATYGLGPGQGLLDYACQHMVDTKDDVLVHMTLIDFFSDLLDMRMSAEVPISSQNASLPYSPNSSVTLDFLIERKIDHAATKFYLHPDDPSIDPLDKSFLTSRSANYLATYASNYPLHLLSARISGSSDTHLLQLILKRIFLALDPPIVQRGQQAPSYDLHLLASLPRVALLPQRSNGSQSRQLWRESPVSLIPIERTHEEFLKTLAVLFHGPERDSEMITFPSSSAEAAHDDLSNFRRQEAVAACELYAFYSAHHPTLYASLVEHAEKIALKETALASIALISAILTANWTIWDDRSAQTLDTTAPFSVLTEDELNSSRASTRSCPNGLRAVTTPRVRATTLPYFFTPSRSFSNLVGGRGDVESAAYKVAIAKFDLLLLLRDMCKKHPEEARDVQGPLENAIARGPWGNEGDVGGRIGTLEM